MGKLRALGRWGATAALLSLVVACEGTMVGSPAGPSGGSGAPGSGDGVPGGRTGDGAGRGGSEGAVGSSSQGLDCDAEGPHAAEAPLRRLTAEQYTNTVQDLFDGQVTASDGFPSTDSGLGRTGFSTDTDGSVVSVTSAEAIAQAAEEVALQVWEKLDTLLPCASAQAGAACAEELVDTYGPRVFRRPLGDEEREALLAAHQTAMDEHGDFGLATAELVQAMLQMPQFLYLPEVGEGEGDVRRLTGFERAARLSYLMWNTMPDQALFDAAESGALDTADGLRAQAERLMADPRFDAMFAEFVREWAHLKVYAGGEKNGDKFPEFDAALASAMQEELDRFVADAAQRGEGGFEHLMSGTQTYVNSVLADFYGLPEGTSSGPDDWQRVDLPERAGLLGRAAVLSGLSHPGEVSHVRRGVFVVERLFCSPLGAPPPDAMSSQPDYPAGSTRRERSQILQDTPVCGGCHQVIDPVGLSLDGFDAIGKWMGPEMDTSGELKVGDSSVVGEIDGAQDLALRLSDSENVRRCTSVNWLRYALGRMETRSDACGVQQMQDRLIERGDDLAEIFAGLVETDGFQFRKLEEK